MTLDRYQEALSRLKALRSTRATDDVLKGLVEVKDEVLARYGPMFTQDGVDALTVEAFRDFLMFRNNRHWSGLQRMGPSITQDIETLKQALHELLDETLPVGQRLDALLPGGKSRVQRLGKAVLTPILLISQPDLYSVWNGTSEGAMRELGIWPEFGRGASIGERYEELNTLLLEIAAELGEDLWTLDAYWWRVIKMPVDPVDGEMSEDEEVAPRTTGVHFSLERHLQDFLLDNWENTRLSKNWDLVEEGGDIKGYGYERPTPIGRIDLLAHHKSEPRWLVIELKRAQTSDGTLGQVQRYMGWVMKELAEERDTVEGLIIAQEEDERLRYALTVAQGVRFMRYKVDFHLLENRS